MRVGTSGWMAAYGLVVAAFLATVATYYHPDYGFTAFIEFPASNHANELIAVQMAPHFDHPSSGGYDGQYYAQLAVDPLVTDPAIDVALDNPPYRARRILFSWTAWAAGLGRPAWILQAYAVQAVLGWLVLAGLLAHWLPPTSGRHFALWAAALLAHGSLMSVRYALTDVPAAAILVVGVLAAERGRPLAAAALIGISGLARDTSLCAAAMLARVVGRSWTSWLLVLASLFLVVAPLALWLDYLRAVFRSTEIAGSEHLLLPLSGLWWKIGEIAGQFGREGLSADTRDNVFAIVAFVTQASWLVWRFLGHRDRSPWVLMGLGFLALALVADRPVWEGTPGAYPRVILPMMLAARVSMAREPGTAWWVIGLSALDIVPGIRLLLLFSWPA